MASPRKAFTLYWSSLRTYEDCPQSFLWGRGWGTIDVGGGPGRPKPLPEERSKHHAVMGIVLADFWEALYNNEEWKHPAGLMDRLLERAKKCFDRELMNPRNFVDWRLAPTRDELWETVEQGIRGYLVTMKANKLLGPFAKSEMDLTCYIDKWTPIGGRADLIFRRDDTGITILDGKNSKRYKDRKTGEFMTHTDPDQLRWYALCFYLSYKKFVDRLGFVYFRYPYGATKLDTAGNPIPVLDDHGLETGDVETETGVDWVTYTKDDLKGIARRAKDAFRGMQREKFPAIPTPPKCKFCDFENVCAERQAQKQANRRVKKTSEAFFDGMTGIQTFGMGPGGSIIIPNE